MLRHYHFYDRSSGHDVGIGPTPSANERPQRRLLSRLLWRPSDRCRLIKPSPTNLHKSRRRYSAIRMAGTLVNPTGSVPRRCFRRRATPVPQRDICGGSPRDRRATLAIGAPYPPWYPRCSPKSRDHETTCGSPGSRTTAPTLCSYFRSRPRKPRCTSGPSVRSE